MHEHLHERIRARLDALSLTPEAASRAAGMDKTFLRKLFERDGSMRAESMAAMARALQTTQQYLLGETDDPAAPTRATPAAAEIRPAPVALPPRDAMPNDVPVLGTVAGSHAGGAFQLSTDVVDWVRRPPALMGARHAYALYVEGTSMVPEHNPGDLRFVHPDRPPRIGDSVVVQIQNSHADLVQATLGRLLKRTSELVVIGKLNPEATVEIQRETVRAVHKVLTMNELFGV